MNKLLFLSMVFLIGCTEGETEKYIRGSKYSIKCIGIGNNLIRCENIEAVCYMSKFTLSVVHPYCKFKKETGVRK